MDDDLSVITGGSAADRAERLTRSMRDQSFPNVKPRDSATLILVDHAAKVPVRAPPCAPPLSAG
jgi:hypothetical protein